MPGFCRLSTGLRSGESPKGYDSNAPDLCRPRFVSGTNSVRGHHQSRGVARKKMSKGVEAIDGSKIPPSP